MDTSLLEQELEPLNAQIEETRAKIETLKDDLRVVEAELDTFSDDKQRFDTLREVCEGLDKLGTLGAGELFWSGVAEPGAAAGHLEQVREQVAHFEKEFQIVERRRQGLREQTDRCQEALDYLFEEVHDAFAREERRLEEFAIVREISPMPHGPGIMPWTHAGESERRFRRTLMVSLLWTLLFSIVIPFINVPIPDRIATVVEIPERLATLVKKDPPKPEPLRRRKPELAKADATKPDSSAKPEPASKSKGGNKVAKAKARPAGGGGGGGSPGARQRARTTGVMAFKSSFADLMDEVPVASLGTEARLKNSKQVAGQAVAHRSLVATQAKSGGSGGISNFGVSRNLGNGGSGGGSGYGKGGGHGSGNGTGWGAGSGSGYGGTGVGIGKVQSAVAGLTEEAGRPLSDGPGPGRTDEEIQIVFDRYKATLYRIYNRKLREDPTLRGKLLLRLTIEPGGEVSMCMAESTDLASAELVAQIVARVKRFNFGPKEGVPQTTILYPIDFLPAG